MNWHLGATDDQIKPLVPAMFKRYETYERGTMANLFKGFCIVLVAAITSAFTTYFYHKAMNGKFIVESVSYQDFVSISLTALGMMLAILGLFIAVAGIIGGTSFETKLKDHSINYFKNQLSKDGELRSELETLFTDIAYEGIEEIRSQTKQEDAESEYND